MNIFKKQRKRSAAQPRPNDTASVVLAAMSDAMLLVDPQARIRSVNHGAATMLGWREEELLGKPLKRFLPEELVKSMFLDTGIDKLITASVVRDVETTLTNRQGREIPVSLSAGVVRSDGGGVDGIVCICRDASERRHAEQERERLILKLQEALDNVKTLKGLLPICAWCKKIKDDDGYWARIEDYLSTRSEVDFTHGLCPECHEKMKKQLGEIQADGTEEQQI